MRRRVRSKEEPREAEGGAMQENRNKRIKRRRRIER